LLLKHPDIIWVGAAADIETAQKDIMTLQPDTVLFEKTKDNIPVNVFEILEAETWDMRIIGLSLDDNEMSIYHHEHQTAVEAGDLLQFVLG
jgi:hypothetical protein